MHTKFEDALTLIDKVIFMTSRKCCKNKGSKRITQRQHELDLRLFRTALRIFKFHNFQVSNQSDDR